MISCCLRRVVLLATIVVSRYIAVEAAVTIDAYPSTQPVPLGTTVVLVCRVVGVSEEGSSANYQWSCPNGACDISSGTRGQPRSRIVSSNTLTVNVVSKSDSGEYRCTVSEGGTTKTSSYNMTVSGGIALYTVEARKPVRVLQSHSVISSPDEIDSGFFKVSISCVGDGSSAVGQWRGPNGSAISANFFAPTYQKDGRLLISRLNREYSNGNYKCRIGDEEAVIGLYFTSGSLVGTYSGNISNFRATVISSSTTRLSWNALTNPDPSTTTTVGYFVSYGRVDHGVKENIVVDRGSTTDVDLTNLDSGVGYEATIRGFSEDGVDRRVSTPVVSVRWGAATTPTPYSITLSVSEASEGGYTSSWNVGEGLTFTCSINDAASVPCTSPYSIADGDLPLADNKFTVRALQGETVVDNATYTIKTCKLSGISPLSRKYTWPAGFVVFKWSTHGNTESTRCKLDGGEEEACDGVMKYDIMRVVTVGRHEIEVIAYCKGAPVDSEKRRFRALSGIPKDPVNCQRMEVQNASVTYSPSEGVISVEFATSTPARCVCKIPAISQVKRSCKSGHQFTGVILRDFDGHRQAKVNIFCKSKDCNVKQKFPAIFTIPET